MPVGTTVPLLFLLALRPWEALPHPCWARASCPVTSLCSGRAQFSPAAWSVNLIQIPAPILFCVPAPAGSGGVW